MTMKEIWISKMLWYEKRDMFCMSSDMRKKFDPNEYDYNAACSSCITLVYVHNELKKWS
jgi:hypothetical protein